MRIPGYAARERLPNVLGGVMGETILLNLGCPVGCQCTIWCHGQQRNDRLHILELLGQPPHVCAQLGCGLAIFGNVVHAREVLGLASVAFRPHSITLGLSFSAALACYGCDLATGSAQGICAGNGRVVLASSVCQGAPKALLGCQRGFVVRSGGRCRCTNHKVGLSAVVEMEWDLAFVPFRRVLANDELANSRSDAKSSDMRCLSAPLPAARIPPGLR
jgi:hypothetical protein